MKILSAIVMALSVLLLSACGGGSKTASVSTGEKALPLRYASQLQLSSLTLEGSEDSLIVARVRNPWDTTRLLHTYVLAPMRLDSSATQGAALRDRLPENLRTATVVRTPLQRSVVYSSIHCSLLHRLSRLSQVAGVCDLGYMLLPAIHHAHKAGRIADLGSGMNPNMESLIDLQPDAILLSPYENSGGYGRIEKLQIPIIECADYMESSPLGQAEWMRLYGRLYGCASQADSLFACVEERYNHLKAEVEAHIKAGESAGKDPRTICPSVFTDLKNGSAWYVPGGRSTPAIFLRDAGARYVFGDNKSYGSIPMAFESVFDRAREADFWLIKYNQATDKTLSELQHDFAPYAGFRAFKEGRVYGCNTHDIPFYEESPFAPDELLGDYVRLFHPELMQKTDASEAQPMKYFRTLAK